MDYARRATCREVEEAVAGNIAGQEELISILGSLRKGSYLFIDEVHRLAGVLEECLHSAMDDGGVTIVAATTRMGALSAPFRSRFKHIERLEPYAEEELAEVVTRAARKLGTEVSPEAALEVARRSRGTPRESLRILERARDIAQVEAASCIDLAHVGQAAERLGIDQHGLDRVERAAVTLLIERGRPLGREATRRPSQSEGAASTPLRGWESISRPSGTSTSRGSSDRGSWSGPSWAGWPRRRPGVSTAHGGTSGRPLSGCLMS